MTAASFSLPLDKLSVPVDRHSAANTSEHGQNGQLLKGDGAEGDRVIERKEMQMLISQHIDPF